MKFKKCFQYRHFMKSHNYYIPLEALFEYEHSTKYIFSGSSSESILNEIDDEDFNLAPHSDRIILQDVEAYLEQNKDSSLNDLENYCLGLAKGSTKINQENVRLLFKELPQFLKVIPQLPEINKQFIDTETLNININQSRADIIALITGKAVENELALLSLYTYRDMTKTDWRPFIKAAMERNPVSLEGLKGKSADEVYRLITALPNDSIYDGHRLAQPDEVWNFQRGDGIEKALLYANYLRNEKKESRLHLIIDSASVTLETDEAKYTFDSQKEIVKQVNL